MTVFLKFVFAETQESVGFRVTQLRVRCNFFYFTTKLSTETILADRNTLLRVMHSVFIYYFLKAAVDFVIH